MRQQELRTLLGVIAVDTHELILSYYSDKRAHSFLVLRSLNPPLDMTVGEALAETVA